MKHNKQNLIRDHSPPTELNNKNRKPLNIIIHENNTPIFYRNIISNIIS
jgi:hypothetical protein